MSAVKISAVHLRKEGDKTIVDVEVNGKWVEIIRENSGAPFSHICEAAGIEAKIKEQAVKP